MAKAFDWVWHDGLIYKLKANTDLTTCIVKLIKSFLVERTYQIRISGHISIPRQIQAGFPQGSCLSPFTTTLYIHYINDLPLIDRVQTSIFADE